MIEYSVVGRSEVGKIREHNEDAFYFSKTNGFMLVSDGMGGLDAGEVASTLTKDIIVEQIEKFDGTNIEMFFKNAFNKANEKVKELANKLNKKKGMGCTCVALHLSKNGDFCLAHVGDSRVYLQRKGVLKQITNDHSYVEELFLRGLISEEEKKAHPYKNAITRYIGSQTKLEVDIVSGPLKNNDVFLLCSDGLSSEVDDNEIQNILNLNTELEQIADNLINSALNNGGKDNITLVLARVERKKTGFFKKILGW